MPHLSRAFSFKRHRRRRGHRWTGGPQAEGLTLADIPVGGRVRVRGFAPDLSGDRRAHLQSYGLLPGYWVLVLQRFPTMVVQIEHLELALENGLACLVQVEAGQD